MRAQWTRIYDGPLPQVVIDVTPLPAVPPEAVRAGYARISRT